MADIVLGRMKLELTDVGAIGQKMLAGPILIQFFVAIWLQWIPMC